MTDEHERETPAQPAGEPFNDGWWDVIIAEAIELIDGPRDERERGPGR